MFSNIIDLPTKYGILKCFSVKEGNKEHLVLYKGEIEGKEIIVRIHSECLTGDLFKSQKCDCGYQLNESLEMITKENGVLIYLRQEGRDIGLFNKIQAYNLQAHGMDTVEANMSLGLPIDARDYSIAAKILNKLAPSKIRLITNNPQKIEALRELLSIEIERISICSPKGVYNSDYLATKALKMNHLI